MLASRTWQDVAGVRYSVHSDFLNLPDSEIVVTPDGDMRMPAQSCCQQSLE